LRSRSPASRNRASAEVEGSVSGSTRAKWASRTVPAGLPVCGRGWLRWAAGSLALGRAQDCSSHCPFRSRFPRPVISQRRFRAASIWIDHHLDRQHTRRYTAVKPRGNFQDPRNGARREIGRHEMLGGRSIRRGKGSGGYLRTLWKRLVQRPRGRGRGAAAGRRPHRSHRLARGGTNADPLPVLSRSGGGGRLSDRVRQ
jgi:hypothetical protein